MPKAADPFAIVRKLGLALPEVEVGTTYGTPALKTHGHMFACIASNKSAEPDTLCVRVDFHDRDYLLTSNPNVFYLKPHYVNYPCVLVRLSRIRRAQLKELLEIGHEFVSKQRKPKRGSG